MSVATKQVRAKKPKLDFQAMLGDPDKQEPRSLCDIHAEVGFPFTARVVADRYVDYPYGLPADPIGTERTFRSLLCGGGVFAGNEQRIEDGRWFSEELDTNASKDVDNVVYDGWVLRWILLGHR
jgi:hypothetical protein